MLVVLVYLLLGFAARVGRSRLIKNAVLFGLLILQVLLAWFGFEVPAIGFFHPINALLIFGLSGSMAWDVVARSRSRAGRCGRAGVAPARYSGWLCAVPPTRYGVVTPSYVRCIVEPVGRVSEVVAVIHPDARVVGAERDLVALGRDRRRACPSTMGCLTA